MADTAVTTSNPAPRREQRKANPDRLPFGKLLAWAGAGVSAGANFIVLSYLTMYATDTLQMSPATIGSIIAVGTLVNAVMAFVAGWIVDRTPENRWGKARPYELAVPLLWLLTGILFAVPSSLTGNGAAAWILIVILLIRGIAVPLLNANDTLYMARAFPSRIVYAKVQTRAGIITAVCAIVISMSLPIFLNRAGKSPEAWTMVIAAYSVVLGILGLSRGVFVKEVYKAEAGEEQVRIRDVVAVFKANRWMFVLFAMYLFAQAMFGANLGSYYFRYVVGNLGMQAVLAPLGLLMLPLLLLVPWLMRHFPVSLIIAFTAGLGIIGGIVTLAAGANIPLLMLGSVLTGVGSLPISYLGVVMLLDLATYNESLGLRRLESTLGALNGVASAVGTAAIAAVVGAIMAASGYDGSLATQTPGATLTIRLMYGLTPIIGYTLIAFFMLWFSRFERKVLPQAQALAAERRQSHGLTAEGKVADQSAVPAPEATP